VSRILIAGCGYVGSALGAALAGEGHEVWGMRRGDAPLPDGVHPLRADLTAPRTLASLPARTDVVVFAAGPRAARGQAGEEAYRAIYLEGLGHLLHALAERGERPARVYLTSSTAVYGQDAGEWIDETSPTEPSRFSGDVLLAAESLLLAGPLPGTVVRFGGIYGPGRTRLVEAVRAGRARVRPGGPHYTNRVHRDDAAGILHHLIGREIGGAGREGGSVRPEAIYLGVDCEPADEAEVLRWIARELGAASPPEAAPGELGPRRAGSKRCRNARLLSSGYRFRYPSFREGYRELLGGGEAC
jgi:nucleoside-diphosphate-sugar epimerase